MNLSRADNQACEKILCRALLRKLGELAAEGDSDSDGDNEHNIQKVLIKITLRSRKPPTNIYCYAKTASITPGVPGDRIPPLSGGYNQIQCNITGTGARQRKYVVAGTKHNKIGGRSTS